MTTVQLVERKPSESLIAGLRSQVCYHVRPEHPSFVALKQQGIDVQPVPAEGVPDGSTLLVPAPSALEDLVHVVDRLLGPGGCPWDQAQTHESLKRHLIEEAYELLEAIDKGDEVAFKEELGDVLLQPIMHAQMKKLAGSFDSEEVAEEIRDKLIRRHPHVFGDTEANDAETVLKNWDQIKMKEKGGRESLLDGVPHSMPSLLRAYEISKRAARAGFEWPDFESVWQKLREEEAELQEALGNSNATEIESEIGDLLFTVVNIARWAKVEPEEALRKMLTRFTQRFQTMESIASKDLKELSPEEWDEMWTKAKTKEPSNG